MLLSTWEWVWIEHRKHLSCTTIICFPQEEFEDTKGVIRIRKSKKDRLQNGQKKDKIYNIYKTLRIKLKIE